MSQRARNRPSPRRGEPRRGSPGGSEGGEGSRRQGPLRASRESRGNPAVDALTEALTEKSPIVREVPCRECGAPVGITQMAIDILRMFNRTIARRGWRLIGEGEVLLCDGCAAGWRRQQRDASNAHSANVTAAVMRLKNGLSQNESADRDYVRRNHERGQACLDAIDKQAKKSARRETV